MRLILSGQERRAKKWALSKKIPWSVDGKKSGYRYDPRSQLISAIKKRIKKYHLKVQQERCCYCRVPLKSRNFETDREHIIPKGTYKQLSFDFFNISVACKTCNMSVKSNRTTHLSGYRKAKKIKFKNIKDPRNYNIVHPNIHEWHDHIDLYSEESGKSVVRIYFPVTRRGRFTYDFFRLGKLEIYNNNQEQVGRNTKKVSRSPHPGIAKLERQFNQG